MRRRVEWVMIWRWDFVFSGRRLERRGRCEVTSSCVTIVVTPPSQLARSGMSWESQWRQSWTGHTSLSPLLLHLNISTRKNPRGQHSTHTMEGLAGTQQNIAQVRGQCSQGRVIRNSFSIVSVGESSDCLLSGTDGGGSQERVGEKWSSYQDGSCQGAGSSRG